MTRPSASLPRAATVAFFASFAASAASAAAQAQVWRVDDDGGPGVDFADVQSAVDAAGEQDLILLESGAYEGFVIDEKSLAVLPAPGAAVAIRGEVVVENLQGVQWCLLRGLESAPDAGLPGARPLRFALRASVGTIWLEDCVAGPRASEPAAPPDGRGEAVTVENCTSASFVRCELAGAPGALPAPGATALDVFHSNVHLFDSTLVGGAGADSDGVLAPTAGGRGMLLDAFTGSIDGCAIAGGAGGDGAEGAACEDGAAGGAGLAVMDPVTIYYLRDVVLEGGAGGASPCGSGGAKGARLSKHGGFLSVFESPTRRFSVESPVLAGETAARAYHGEPGDLVFTLRNVFQDKSFVPELENALLVGEPYAIEANGPMPASGLLRNETPPTAVPPGAEFLPSYQQMAVLTAGGEMRLGAPSALIVLLR